MCHGNSKDNGQTELDYIEEQQARQVQDRGHDCHIEHPYHDHAEWVNTQFDDEPQCEHGLSEWLCEGPGHYPSDSSYLRW